MKTRTKYTQFQPETIRALYASGLSTREVEALTGVNNAVVYRMCEDIRRSRFRPDSRNGRTCRRRARQMMEAHLGRKLLRSEYVHHINHDFTDNRIENLGVMKDSEHTYLHARKPDQPHSSTKEYFAQWREKHRDSLNARNRAWRKQRAS